MQHIPTQSFYAQDRAAVVRLGDEKPARQVQAKPVKEDIPHYFKGKTDDSQA